MHALDETIVAIASPPGGAARGIVRLSGPDLRNCLEGCFRPDPPRASCLALRADGRARLPLARRLCLAAAVRTLSLARQAKLHGPAGGRGPHARLAAASGSRGAGRLLRRRTARRAGRVHAPRSSSPDAST